MRLVWLSIIALVCVGMAFLFRTGFRAHAEKVADAIEQVHSNTRAKGDRLDLLYRPSNRQPPAAVQPVLAAQEPAAIEPVPARPAPANPGPPTSEPAKPEPARSETSKSTETVSWHWREGAKTITRISASGEKTQLSRAKAR